MEVWQGTAPDGYQFGSLYPVAADIDGDSLAEYLIGLFNYQEWDFWLYAFNIEDGSILWQHNVGDFFKWSTPSSSMPLHRSFPRIS